MCRKWRRFPSLFGSGPGRCRPPGRVSHYEEAGIGAVDMCPGDLMFVDQIKDTLDQIESTCATGGILQSRTYTDFSETKTYYSRTSTYDSSGAVIDTVTVGDGIFGGVRRHIRHQIV